MHWELHQKFNDKNDGGFSLMRKGFLLLRKGWWILSKIGSQETYVPIGKRHGKSRKERPRSFHQLSECTLFIIVKKQFSVKQPLKKYDFGENSENSINEFIHAAAEKSDKKEVHILTEESTFGDLLPSESGFGKLLKKENM